MNISGLKLPATSSGLGFKDLRLLIILFFPNANPIPGHENSSEFVVCLGLSQFFLRYVVETGRATDLRNFSKSSRRNKSVAVRRIVVDGELPRFRPKIELCPSTT